MPYVRRDYKNSQQKNDFNASKAVDNSPTMLQISTTGKTKDVRL